MRSNQSLLMALVRSPTGQAEESEPLLVWPNGSTVGIELEDGRRYYVDAVELGAAMRTPGALVGADAEGPRTGTTPNKEAGPRGGA